MTDKPVPERTPIEKAEIQLFDPKADPNERNDLAEAMPEKTREMEERLMNWYNAVEKERLS